MRARWLVVALLAACSKSPKQSAGTGSSGSGSAAVASDGSIGSTASDARVDDRSSFFPVNLAASEGIVLAETQGGTAGGIPDGTRVEVVGSTDMKILSVMTGEVKVRYKGEVVALSPARVLRGTGALYLSPDAKYAIYAPLTRCDNVCFSEIWLVGADGRRTKLGEGHSFVDAAWKPDTVAIGSGALWLITLASFHVTKLGGYSSPSFSPEGVLYVRDDSGSAYTLIAGKAQRVWQAPAQAVDDDPYDVDDPPPVRWKDGKPIYSLSYVSDDAE